MPTVVNKLCDAHQRAPRRVRAIDTFMVFLVALGVYQLVFCVLVGNYPFNAFLGGAAATVGQFVLLAALRIQIENEKNFTISPQRAFAEFTVASLVLHFLVLHFIN